MSTNLELLASTYLLEPCVPYPPACAIVEEQVFVLGFVTLFLSTLRNFRQLHAPERMESTTFHAFETIDLRTQCGQKRY